MSKEKKINICKSCPNLISLRNKNGYCYPCFHKPEIRKMLGVKLQSKTELNCPCGNKFLVKKSHAVRRKFCSLHCRHRFSLSVANKIEYNNIWYRSSWERAFAKWLDENNLSFKYEPTAIKLTNGYYTPDFWVNEWSCYVEVKGYWRDDARVKYEEAKELIDIKIIDYLWFENQGFFISKRRGICRVY